MRSRLPSEWPRRKSVMRAPFCSNSTSTPAAISAARRRHNQHVEELHRFGRSGTPRDAAAELMQLASRLTIHGGRPLQRWVGCFVTNHPIDPRSATSVCFQPLTSGCNGRDAKVSAIPLKCTADELVALPITVSDGAFEADLGGQPPKLLQLRIVRGLVSSILITILAMIKPIAGNPHILPFRLIPGRKYAPRSGPYLVGQGFMLTLRLCRAASDGASLARRQSGEDVLQKHTPTST